MKYPLTENAKKVARELVDLWNSNSIPQLIHLSVVYEIGPGESIFSHNARFDSIPSMSIWLELAEYKLVKYTTTSSTNIGDNFDILLLQELRNAVENNFEVLDATTTTHSIGNIILNSTTGPVQGVGYNTGIVHQNVEQLADYMTATLGEEFLANQADLATAIQELRTSLDSNRQSKLGKVVSELGNCLQHGANAYAVTSALVAVAPFIQRMLGG